MPHDSELEPLDVEVVEMEPPRAPRREDPAGDYTGRHRLEDAA